MLFSISKTMTKKPFRHDKRDIFMSSKHKIDNLTKRFVDDLSPKNFVGAADQAREQDYSHRESGPPVVP